MKTGFRSLSLVPRLAGAAVVLLAMSSVGCVVAATGTDTTDEKSQTQELDSTDTTGTTAAANGDVPKLPSSEAVKAGGQGGGPDPSPWRATDEAENGGPNGPDPSPWDVNSTAASNTRK